MPWNAALLKKREDFQSQIDQWHLKNNKTPFDLPAYKRFLKDIGYLLKEGEDFLITTDGVDPEISNIAGPQLVVPVMNARFSLNAANARWGSLYDALYGTDVISEKEGAEKGAPKYMEWYGAFGLLVTLIWLYLEVLRLLAKLNS